MFKWYYDENRIFPNEAILKHKQVAAWEEKCCLLISNISFRSRDIQVFKICILAKWWRHTFNQIFIKCDEKRNLSQFVSEMFDSLQDDSTKFAPQNKCNSFVTLPNIKGISGHLWHSIFIFTNGASYTWSSKHTNMLARVCGLV